VSGLADVDFRALQQYLLDTAGLVFDESRRAGLASFVTERLRTTGSPGVAAYLEWIRTEDGAGERQHLLDGVTVQETHFFRNAPQMTALRRRVLPELLRRTAGRERPLTIWSAGCSTGEEPYSLSMMVLDLASPASASPPRIVATDVSAAALATARRATYAGRSLESAPVGMQERWFEPRHGAAMTVSPKVRALVDFRLHNLVAEEPPFDPGEVDLVVCRNVTIYFDRATTRRLVNIFHRVLAEGGYLLLGHSETLWQVSDDFALVPVGDAFVYRRSHDSSLGAPGGSRHLAARGAGHAPAARRVKPRATVPARAVSAAHPSPAADLNTVLGEARAALAAGDYEGATRAGAAAVQAQSLQPVAYVVLGRALTATGQDAAAADVLRKAVYLDPTAGDAHFLLAGALSRQGLHGPAGVSYRAAAKTLHRVPSTVLDDLFGGRALPELVDLCHQLAGDSDERAQSAPVAAGGTT
jgi:chemotaxis protein methyltransferase CheR